MIVGNFYGCKWDVRIWKIMGFWNRKNGFFTAFIPQLTRKLNESCFLIQDETRWRKKYPQGGWGWDRRQNEFRLVLESMSIIPFMAAVKMQNIGIISTFYNDLLTIKRAKEEISNFLRCSQPRLCIAITSETCTFKTKLKRMLYTHCDQNCLAPNWHHFEAFTTHLNIF